MLELLKIAITGGVSAGKTSVCRFFQELGAFIIDADQIVHELLVNDSDVQQEIKHRLGEKIFTEGKIDRNVLGKQVFTDPKQLQILERILHPKVLKQIYTLYQSCDKKKYSSFVVEMPLLFEIGAESFYDFTVTVIADETLALDRFRDKGFDSTEYKQRMQRQLPPIQKGLQSDYILQNNGSLEDLRKQVIELNRIFQKPKE